MSGNSVKKMSLISYDKDCTIFTSQEKSEMLEIFQRIKQVMLTPLHFEIFTLAMLYHTELYEDMPSLSAYRSVADRLVYITYCIIQPKIFCQKSSNQIMKFLYPKISQILVNFRPLELNFKLWFDIQKCMKQKAKLYS